MLSTKVGIMIKPKSLMRSEKAQGSELGQILPMAAFLVIPLLIVSAFAVDLGSFYHRASQLQSASDLASLAGADLKSQGVTESEVRDVVEVVLQDNGIDTNKVSVSVNFSGDEVEVILEDNDVPVYLASLFMDNAEIRRSATAVKGSCAGDCDQPIVISPPLGALPTTSQGDGTAPLAVTADDGTEYIFALNHHLSSNQESTIRGFPMVPQLICVDIEALAFCPGYPRRVNTSTSEMTRLAYSEATNEVWYPIQRPSYVNAVEDFDARSVGATTYLGMGCISLATLGDCGEMKVGATVPHGPEGLLSFAGKVDHGHMSTQIYEIDGLLYMIDGDMNVHCKDPATRGDCAGFPVSTPSSWVSISNEDLVGNPPGSDPGAANLPAGFDSWYNKSGFQPILVVSENRLYGSWPAQSGNYSICFDIVARAACAGFSSRVIADYPNAFGPGLFEDLDSAGNPDGFCSPNWRESLVCVRSDGSLRDRSALEPHLQPSNKFVYIEPFRLGSKLFMPAPQEYLDETDKTTDGRTYCVDLVTNNPCSGGDLGAGVRQDPQPYGYSQLSNRNCLISLGHLGEFSTFDPDTLAPCPAGDGLIEVFPCDCGDGTFFWGELAFGADFLANFDSFSVDVTDAAGTVLIDDADLLASNGRLDLSDLDTSLTSIFIKYESDISPAVTTASPIEGTFSITERATLVD